MFENIGGNTAAVVDDFGVDEFAILPRFDADFARLGQGVDGVVDEVSPHLIHLARTHAHLWQIVGHIHLYFNMVGFDFVMQDAQRTVHAIAQDDDFFVGSAIHVGVFLDGVHQIADTLGGFGNFVHHPFGGQDIVDPIQHG